MDAPKDLWKERLRILREIYALGLHVLGDSRLAASADQPHWNALNQLWAEFAALDPQICGDAPPEDRLVLKELQDLSLVTQDLFKKIRSHCENLKTQVLQVLADLPNAPAPGTQPQSRDRAARLNTQV